MHLGPERLSEALPSAQSLFEGENSIQGSRLWRNLNKDLKKAQKRGEYDCLCSGLYLCRSAEELDKHQKIATWRSTDGFLSCLLRSAPLLVLIYCNYTQVGLKHTWASCCAVQSLVLENGALDSNLSHQVMVWLGEMSQLTYGISVFGKLAFLSHQDIHVCKSTHTINTHLLHGHNIDWVPIDWAPLISQAWSLTYVIL